MSLKEDCWFIFFRDLGGDILDGGRGSGDIDPTLVPAPTVVSNASLLARLEKAVLEKHGIVRTVKAAEAVKEQAKEPGKEASREVSKAETKAR